MTLNEYQDKANNTCMTTCSNVSYMSLNLAAEVGELFGKIAKMVRKGKITINDNDLAFSDETTDSEIVEFRNEIMYEAGDVLWQLAGLCRVFRLPLERVAQANLCKLADRQNRGVIEGNGDHR